MSVEATLIQWLNSQGFEAAHSRPDTDAPSELLTIQRVGGSRQSVATISPTIVIQCWSTSMAKAADLAERVDKIMPRFAFEPDIHRVDPGSIYEFPGANREPRYQATYTITARSCI